MCYDFELTNHRSPIFFTRKKVVTHFCFHDYLPHGTFTILNRSFVNYFTAAKALVKLNTNGCALAGWTRWSWRLSVALCNFLSDLFMSDFTFFIKISWSSGFFCSINQYDEPTPCGLVCVNCGLTRLTSAHTEPYMYTSKHTMDHLLYI